MTNAGLRIFIIEDRTMKITKRQLRRIIKEVTDSDFGRAALTGILDQLLKIPEASSGDEDLADQMFTSLIALLESVLSDKEDLFVSSLGITAAETYQEYVDYPDGLQINFKDLQSQISFEEYLADVGFNQGWEYETGADFRSDVDGSTRFSIRFLPDNIIDGEGTTSVDSPFPPGV